MQQWTEVGTNQPPIENLRGALRVTEISKGTGRTVEVGDLVKIQLVEVFSKSVGDPSPRKSIPRTVWLWTGREPNGQDHTSISTYGDLGSPRLRKNLIHRRVGDRFEIRLDATSEGFVVVPRYGFAVSPVTSGLHSSADAIWPNFNLGYHQPKNTTLAEVLILNSCPGKLLRRSAVMKQWGYVFNTHDMNYRSSREGVLHWGALEGDCEDQDGKVRFEVGPIYYPGPSASKLYNWSDSYQTLRPKEYEKDYRIIRARVNVERDELIQQIRDYVPQKP